MEKPYLTVQEAAKKLGVSPPTIYKTIGKDLSFPVFRPSEGCVRIKADALDEWAAAETAKRDGRTHKCSWCGTFMNPTWEYCPRCGKKQVGMGK